MVPADSIGISRGPIYSGTSRETTRFHLLDCHHLWLAFPCHSVSKWFGNSHVRGPTNQPGFPGWFGLFRVRSPLLTESIFLSFPPGTDMFHFAVSHALACGIGTGFSY